MALVNIPIYKHIVQRRHSNSTHRDEISRCFTLMLCLMSTSSAIIGLLHLSAGFPVPMVPFASPVAGSVAIRASWGVALGSVLVFLLVFNTRTSRTSDAIAEILVADLLRGKSATRAINFLIPTLTVVAIISSLAVGWTGVL